LADLSPRDEALRLDIPSLQGKGRRWDLASGRLGVSNGRAHGMRREPTVPNSNLIGSSSFGKNTLLPATNRLSGQ